MITIDTTIYRCEHCNKLYLRPKWCAKHEAKCFKNPANYRPCFECEHLNDDETESCTYYHFNGVEYTVTRRILYCYKHDVAVYPPNITEPYELLNGDNVPMPKECKDVEQ